MAIAPKRGYPNLKNMKNMKKSRIPKASNNQKHLPFSYTLRGFVVVNWLRPRPNVDANAGRAQKSAGGKVKSPEGLRILCKDGAEVLTIFFGFV